MEDTARRGSSHFISSKQFPRRIRRVPLTDDEIESINGGGATPATAAAESSSRAVAEAESETKTV